MITERDIQILYQLVRLRFLDTRQIESLFEYNGNTQKINVVRRRVRELEKEGLIKTYRPDMYSPQIVHLSKKGAEYCQNYFGLDEVKTYQRNSHTNHIMKIADFYIAIYELGYTIEKFITDFQIQISGNNFRPDIFFSILKEKRILGFIEIDMGTYQLKRVVAKLPYYEAIYKSGNFQKNYGSFPTLYFITHSNERAENLRLKLEKEKTTDITYKVTTFEALNNILSLLGGLESA